MLYGILNLTFPFTDGRIPAKDTPKTYPYDSRFVDLYMAALERELRAAAQDEELCITVVRLIGRFDLAGSAHMDRLHRLLSSLFKFSKDCRWITDTEAVDTEASESPDSEAVDTDFTDAQFELGCGLNAVSRFPEGACINTDDLYLYLSHPDEVEKIARPL